jgi:guanylate kinase
VLKGAILILSGPSGAGKSTIINRAKPYIGDFYFSISTTTREPRDGERNGVDYYFVDKDSFEEGIEKGEFLEYANVHNNYYGTSLKAVKENLDKGKLVIFDIDVQGFKLVKNRLKSIITSVFITPPSLKELERRLVSRALDSKDVIEKRLENAKTEIKEIKEYDYLIINDEVDKAVENFITIAKVAKLKPSVIDIEQFILQWK